MKSIYISLFLLLGVLTSCANRYSVTTDTFSDIAEIPNGFLKGTSFSILCQESNSNPLFTKEVSNKIARILEKNGYIATTEEMADYRLEFTFGTTTSSETVTVPKYIPGATIKKEGSAFGSTGHLSYDEETTKSGTTIYLSEIRTYHTQKITIAIYSNEEQIWNGASHITCSDNNLRDTIDYLLVGAFQYFGQNSKKSITTVLSEKDEEIKSLKNWL